ncbi:hypothetical protein [Clostridium gasigenes]|uniref:hypothetical protein n=1 Tax=Clostridium gasigenes TaxID=94869 RepID=UPI001C0D2670|nr:hypothetical protein [Clostridium gasigenes]MBU3109475.1 hypothetical protein [Clostridium gasigenes]
MYDIKRKKEIKEILNKELKIAFYVFTGIRIFNKKASICDVYSESMETGKLNGALHNLFDFDYLITDINKRYKNKNITIRKRDEELSIIEEYKIELQKLNTIVEYMKTLNIKVNDDIMICSISSGKLVYTNRLKELNDYKELIEKLRGSLDKDTFTKILDALKQNIILKSKHEEDRHNINRDRGDEILRKSLKKIKTIIDVKINISAALDVSEEVILNKKYYNKIMKSNLSDNLKELIEEYRNLL